MEFERHCLIYELTDPWRLLPIVLTFLLLLSFVLLLRSFAVELWYPDTWTFTRHPWKLLWSLRPLKSYPLGLPLFASQRNPWFYRSIADTRFIWPCLSSSILNPLKLHNAQLLFVLLVDLVPTFPYSFSSRKLWYVGVSFFRSLPQNLNVIWRKATQRYYYLLSILTNSWIS